MLDISLTAKKFVINPELQKYVTKKLQALEKYIPKNARQSAQLHVVFRQAKVSDKKASTCELTLSLPHENLFASETTLHVYAAVDIAAAHIQSQLSSYKAKHAPGVRDRLRGKFGRQNLKS